MRKEKIIKYYLMANLHNHLLVLVSYQFTFIVNIVNISSTPHSKFHPRSKNNNDLLKSFPPP